MTGATPVPISQLRRPQTVPQQQSPLSFIRQTEDGLYHADTPVPCIGYIFMLCFPFFCMGCCLFGGSKFTFDDQVQVMSALIYRGVFCCGTPREIPYNEIGNVGITTTNVRSNGRLMYTWVIFLTSGEMLRTGAVTSYENVQSRVFELHRFIFGRHNPAYQRPMPGELLFDHHTR